METATVHSRRNAKREHILSVASDLFSKQDYGSVLMDSVAAQARVAKGTIYNYFGSKEALYREVVTSRLEHLISVLRESTRQRDDVRTNVRRMAIHVMSFMLKYPDFFRIWKREEAWVCSDVGHPLARLRIELHKVLVDVLTRGIALDIIRPLDPVVTSALVFGATDGALYEIIGRTLPHEKVVVERDRLDEFIWRAVSAKASHE